MRNNASEAIAALCGEKPVTEVRSSKTGPGSKQTKLVDQKVESMEPSTAIKALCGETYTASQVLESANKARPLSEAIAKDEPEPLAKTYIQYIKNGNTYTPAGKVILADKLGTYPYKIVRTMTDIVFERVQPATDEIINFKDSQMGEVLQEIDKFWSRKENYAKLKLMHNRGLLLASKPGFGKSVLLQQVAEMMAKRGDIVLFADSPSVMAEGLKAFRQIEEKRGVVICFEEADELVRYDERALLQLMDGDAKIGGVLFLGTTNYPERLPERMKRPGRLDRIIELKAPTYSMRLQYLQHKLKGIEADEKQVESLAKQSEGFGFGHMRELIAGVYAIGDSADSVLKRLRSERPGPSDYQGLAGVDKMRYL